MAITEGEFVIFVGPSGCGKSTLLRAIAGLEDITAGEMTIDGHSVVGAPPVKRGLAMVFQSYALYPHMTVADNLGFSLKTAGIDKAEAAVAVSRAASALQLDPLLDRKPKDLSGGQRQRVAIGRAIVRDPTAFLFDEPLSNLDAALRVDMRHELARLHARLGKTMIYVTHDQVEAMTLADRIVVLNQGKVEQVGTPRELYEHPNNLFVAQFIGSPKMNVIAINTLSPAAAANYQGAAQVTHIGARPEDIELIDAAHALVHGTIDVVEYLGSDQFVYIDCGETGFVTARADRRAELSVGQAVGIALNGDALHRFDGNGLRV